MKHQQVTVDMTSMIFTACSYLALAGAVWIFLRLIQACFWLPKHLKRQNDVQRMLQEKVESYEKYVLECEEKERAEMLDQIDDEKKNLEMSEKWKERRECLDMLKRELERVREGKDMSDWDALLEEELKKHEEEFKTMAEEEENMKNDVNKEEKSDSEKVVKKSELNTEELEPKKKK
ncbi:trichohyalin isoform X1 [Monomorium pharaonis]|uniref:trichohyalin isoform X1 n=2 Tax=Monomorium pharaonis TaxID=307658 RepID=UPI00063EEB2C|nr:trichohyalin isoform X1 [Monomorium pharaonis]XP_012535817.1 trichohyalin isoform X1 [Monomorium pharaonis]